MLGASTNVALVVNGYPDNLEFTASQTPLLTGYTPWPAGFLYVFGSGMITNLYSYGNVSLIMRARRGTNQILNGALTNFAGRVEIFASNELNRWRVRRLPGPIICPVQSPVQFDGSPGALIQAPYSDLNLGVTNGFLTISNVLDPQIPDWSGPGSGMGYQSGSPLTTASPMTIVSCWSAAT